jgi:Bacteriophage HK97-gp10, putative tail-component
VIGLEVFGDKAVAAMLLRAATTVDAQVARKVTYWAHMLETGIKSRAPVRTGDYRRSWSTQVNGMTARVGTNKPQARRLEYGFVGADSLGRHYNQAPRPHVRPAFDAVRGPFLKDIATVVPK